MVLSIFTETIRPIIMILGWKNHPPKKNQTQTKQATSNYL